MQAIRKPHTVRKAEILRFWDVNIPCQVSKHTLPFIFRYFAIYVDILFFEDVMSPHGRTGMCLFVGTIL